MMKFAPHIGLSTPDDFMFPASAGKDLIEQIKFIADQGFSGIEDNFLKLLLAHSLATCGELNAFVSSARGRSSC